MRKLLIILILGLTVKSVLAQVDSLIFTSGEYMLGEIKSMERGVLMIETDYSDSDFKIEWDKIDEIYAESYLFVSLSSGKKYYGYLKTRSDTSVTITSRDSITVTCKMSEIVHMLPINQGFKDRFSAEIDVGLSFAKSGNLKQLTVAALIGYKTEKWTSYVTYNTLRSIQDEVDPILRTESDFVFQYVIYKDWYLVPSTNFLASSEQELRYRWNAQFGFGNYIVRSNNAYWGISLGINRNKEEYTSDTPKNQSWEGYFGTELNLFDIGDLNLFTKIIAYPSMTESGRLRIDGSMNIKYDLPLDFYIKLGGSLNYDNKTIEQVSEIDYVTTIGFGWEW